MTFPLQDGKQQYICQNESCPTRNYSDTVKAIAVKVLEKGFANRATLLRRLRIHRSTLFRWEQASYEINFDDRVEFNNALQVFDGVTSLERLRKNLETWAILERNCR